MTTSQFKEWRKRMRLSQEAAAEALGLSRNTIVRYETDHETPQVVDLACAYLEEHGPAVRPLLAGSANPPPLERSAFATKLSRKPAIE